MSSTTERALRRGRPALVVLVVGLALAACSATPLLGPPSTSRATAASGAVYLSIGDSYAAGYQPEGFPTDQGFAEQLTAELAGGADAVTLLNYGCPGATTSAMVEDVGCADHDSAPGTVFHPGTTQLAAATAAMARNAGKVRLVTVIGGGNDVRGCFDDDDPTACVTTAVPGIRTHLTTILAAIRAQAPGARIVGLTYPDIYLGLLLTGSASDARRATASVAAFRDVLNPTFKEVYDAAGATFVDATAESGAYEPLTDTTVLQGRTVPKSVAVVCGYTHFCESGDVHPTTSGYAWYAQRILGVLPGAATATSASGS